MNKFRFLTATALLLLARPGLAQNASPQQMTDRAAARFLDQATWGPTPASILELQQMGIDDWLSAQFALNTSDLPDQAILTTDGKSNNDLRPVQSAFFANAVSGQDQLRQRVAFILSQIWVVSAVQVQQAYAYPPYWRIFRDNAFGNYRDIIKAVTLSPAMGAYLNMANNNKGNAARGTAANENYARELMQLFTLGLTQLNMDGTPVLDTSHNPVPTYNQSVVTNLAKALTGWTYPTAPGATARSNNPAYFVGPMFAVEANHDTTEKDIFSSLRIQAGQTAEADLESLLGALMAQPTMAPFVSQQLIEHLVTSNPSPGYISRVAAIFKDNGQGVTGDMKAVITAILKDPEARAADDYYVSFNPNFGHLREPILFLPSMLRALNATLTSTSAINSDTTLLGQNLFNPASVFSYFSPQFRTEKGLLGPEFQIYSTQTAAERADLINSAVYGSLDRGTTVDLTPFVQAAGNVDTLIDYVSFALLHHGMTPALHDAIHNAVSALPATNPKARAQAALYLALTSGEYQVVQ